MRVQKWGFRITVGIGVVLFVVGTALAQTQEIDSLKEKAEQGDAHVQVKLGMMYDIGQGVPQDYGEARKWFRKAAEQGNASAQYSARADVLQREGVPQDYGEAVKWCRKAAEQGNAGAQFNARGDV